MAIDHSHIQRLDELLKSSTSDVFLHEWKRTFPNGVFTLIETSGSKFSGVRLVDMLLSGDMPIQKAGQVEVQQCRAWMIGVKSVSYTSATMTEALELTAYSHGDTSVVLPPYKDNHIPKIKVTIHHYEPSDYYKRAAYYSALESLYCAAIEISDNTILEAIIPRELRLLLMARSFYSHVQRMVDSNREWSQDFYNDEDYEERDPPEPILTFLYRLERWLANLILRSANTPGALSAVLATIGCPHPSHTIREAIRTFGLNSDVTRKIVLSNPFWDSEESYDIRNDYPNHSCFTPLRGYFDLADHIPQLREAILRSQCAGLEEFTREKKSNRGPPSVLASDFSSPEEWVSRLSEYVVSFGREYLQHPETYRRMLWPFSHLTTEQKNLILMSLSAPRYDGDIDHLNAVIEALFGALSEPRFHGDIDHLELDTFAAKYFASVLWIVRDSGEEVTSKLRAVLSK